MPRGDRHLNRVYRVNAVEFSLAEEQVLEEGFLPFVRAVFLLQQGSRLAPRERPRDKAEGVIAVFERGRNLRGKSFGERILLQHFDAPPEKGGTDAALPSLFPHSGASRLKKAGCLVGWIQLNALLWWARQDSNL